MWRDVVVLCVISFFGLHWFFSWLRAVDGDLFVIVLCCFLSSLGFVIRLCSCFCLVALLFVWVFWFCLRYVLCVVWWLYFNLCNAIAMCFGVWLWCCMPSGVVVFVLLWVFWVFCVWCRHGFVCLVDFIVL